MGGRAGDSLSLDLGQSTPAAMHAHMGQHLLLAGAPGRVSPCSACLQGVVAAPQAFLWPACRHHPKNLSTSGVGFLAPAFCMWTRAGTAADVTWHSFTMMCRMHTGVQQVPSRQGPPCHRGVLFASFPTILHLKNLEAQLSPQHLQHKGGKCKCSAPPVFSVQCWVQVPIVCPPAPQVPAKPPHQAVLSQQACGATLLLPAGQ
jgi:hypothetical protein